MLRIAPEHAEATAKLKYARHQAQLAHLEASARQAEAASDWKAAILAWETLLEQAPEHPDAASRLAEAHRQQKLADLYAEAHQLFQAGEWGAVVGAFKQINSLQPGYPDPGGSLEAAKVELAAQERRSQIEMRYRQALGAMEARDWEKAQALLSALAADEPDFEDADALLEKATLEARRQRAEHGAPGGDEVPVHPGSPPGGKRQLAGGAGEHRKDPRSGPRLCRPAGAG